MSSVTVLCPNGHRQKVSTTPNMSILQVKRYFLCCGSGILILIWILIFFIPDPGCNTNNKKEGVKLVFFTFTKIVNYLFFEKIVKKIELINKEFKYFQLKKLLPISIFSVLRIRDFNPDLDPDFFHPGSWMQQQQQKRGSKISFFYLHKNCKLFVF